MTLGRDCEDQSADAATSRIKPCQVAWRSALLLTAAAALAYFANKFPQFRFGKHQPLLKATINSDASLFHPLLSPPFQTSLENSSAGDSPKSRPQRKTQALNINNLIQEFQLGKARLYESLKEDYGYDYFGPIFMKHDGSSRGRNFVSSPSENGPSPERLVRKIAMKLITALIEGMDQSFIWVAGGHSAAAAHGNLFNENYMSVLERNGKDLFKSVHLELKASNFAMGGTTSGMEIASCIEAIFGEDFDVISWDYGMTDGHESKLLEYYCYRATTLSNRPACIAHTSNARTARGRIVALQSLEAAGATVLYINATVTDEAVQGIPDTAEQGGLEDVQAMPKFVRSFKCGKQIEKGDPSCDREKFTKTGDHGCDSRKFRVSWHPGWKSHALTANLKLLSLMDMIDNALQTITKSDSDPVALLMQLKEEDNADFSQLLEDPKFDQLHYKKRPVCHTARLPARARFKGILTESDDKGFDTYFKGIDFESSKLLRLNNGEMPLTYEPSERQSQCSLVLNVDYKDYFISHGSYTGFTTLTIPNMAEKEAYMKPNQKFNGTIAVCFRACSWGRCDKRSVRIAEFNEGKASVQVNGVNVLSMVPFGGDCAFLQGAQGMHGWKENEKGQFVIGILVHDENSFMRWSSVVVW